HVCLKLGGLPVVVGRSGIGKNKLPRFYAEALGCPDEYLHVSVPTPRQENYSFLGDYNASAQRYEPGDSGLLEHLIAAAADQREGRGGIYTICLDHMNFGKIDNFFSRFLHALELPASERRLTLFAPGLTQPGDPFAPYQQLALGDNLRFVATVDTHEAVSSFTPKMLDRCQIVALSAPDFSTPLDNTPPSIQPVALAAYLAWVRAPKTEGMTHSFLLEIHNALKPAHLGLGYRQIYRVLGYVESAQPFFTVDTAVDFQIKQVILPLLWPSAPHFAATVQALARLAPVERFPRSAELLTRIVEARAEDDYFQLL